VKNVAGDPEKFRAVEFTTPDSQGKSHHGFVRLGFGAERLVLDFHVGARGATRPTPLKQLGLGEKPCGFVVNLQGELLDADGQGPC
jgi:hypothetical protein